MGLSTEEAKSRLAEYGPNQLSQKEKKTTLQKIWAQINNILVLVLVVVAVVTGLRAITSATTQDKLTNWIEVALIAFVVILNAWIGIMQEGSAAKAADALKSMLSSDAEVICNGKAMHIPANEVVPDNLVNVNLGDCIPADICFLKVWNLATSEAALTNKSLPIEKITTPIEALNPANIPLGDCKNMGFSATLVSQGRGIGLVVATSDNTQIETINTLVSMVETKKTYVQREIDYVSTRIAILVICCAIVTFCVAFWTTLPYPSPY